ncbi:MAG: hypothetical protein IH994_00115 [Proteobacteria bacterium]|nr:hypothetical protein [Pseudomonadota bacterium]
MTRISSLAANTSLVNQILRTQSRLFNTEIQIASGKISQNYEGIAIDSRRLINLENTRDSLRQFIKNNDRIDIRLNIANIAIDGIQELIRNFSHNLNNFAIGGTKDKIKVQTIQEDAFRTLKSIEDLLNTKIDGRFIFAGGRVDTEPANFGLTTLANFQAIFDGAQIKISQTRDANLADFTINQSNSFSTKTFKSGTLSMTFDATADTITAAAGTFRYPDGTNLAAGAEIVITGTTAGTNDGTYTISSVSADGSTATVKTANTGALSMTFNNAADTVTAAAGTFRNTDGSALLPGQKITFSGAVNGANNATFTIASVSADGSVVTLSGAPVLVDEVAPAATAITGIQANQTSNAAAAAGTPLTFADNNPAADTITGPAGFFKDTAGNLLGVGSKITITNTVSNNGVFTIASVSADGSTATLVAADTLTNETDANATASIPVATNHLTFQRDNGATPPQSIITGQGTPFANTKAGTFITITGTSNNNGTYEVLSVPNPGQIIVRTKLFTNQTVTASTTPSMITAVDGTQVATVDTGDLTFVRDNGATPPQSRVTAAVVGSLATLKVGQKITIAGTTTNDGIFTVAANDGTNLVIVTQMLTDEGTAATPQLSFTSAGAEVTFTDNAPNKDTIVAAAGRFSNLVAGMKVTISGATDAGNNATFTVSSISTDGSTITVDENITARAGDANTVTFLTQEAKGTIAATSYYKGDATKQTHRLDKDRSFEFDINAIDPAFEKAIRGMRLIMQGIFQTEGGLDQNADRIGQAKFLIGSSLKQAVSGTPPFGTEKGNNIEQIQIDLSFDLILINRTNDLHFDFIGFLETSIANVENADPLETITKLLADQRALEASFQTLAKIRQLSLVNFL